jgi:exodeoxyribonuclease X
VKTRVIDFGTTAKKPSVSQICEYGFTDVENGELGKMMTMSQLCYVDAIPPQSRAIHSIRTEWCKDAQPLEPREIDNGTVDAIAAHNAEFEQLYMPTDRPWICRYKVALRRWPDALSHSDGALRYWLADQGKISPDHEMSQPVHRAGPDAYVTAHLLIALPAYGPQKPWSHGQRNSRCCCGAHWASSSPGALWALDAWDGYSTSHTWALTGSGTPSTLDRRATEQKPKLERARPSSTPEKPNKPTELQKIAIKPEAGGFRYLRHRDLLWQGEIVIYRKWEVICEHHEDGCYATKTLTVRATAAEAILATDDKNTIIHLPMALVTLKAMAVFSVLKTWRND